MRASRIYGVSALLGILLLPLTGFGHHSFATTFDRNSVVEREGEIMEVLWQNPHVNFTLKTVDSTGEEVLWVIESHSLSIMRRMDLENAFIQVGDNVRLAGNPARRTDLRRMFVHNILLPTGEEWVFRVGATPADLRWSDRLMGTADRWFAIEGESSPQARGIFRVWSTSFASRGTGWVPRREEVLTASAQAALTSFDTAREAPLANCKPKGMPWIMQQPYPMEFVEDGDQILIRIEEYDLVRTVHMDSATSDESPAASLLGFSTGSWQGETLVVQTTGVNYPYYGERGMPVGDGAEYLERFTPTEDGRRLNYAITITDPATFTESVHSQRDWIWLSDVSVEPYNCVSGA